MIWIGRCEAFDLVPTEADAAYVRCARSGVRITESDGGRPRRRTVCPDHGWQPPHTRPADVDALELARLTGAARSRRA